MATGPEMLMRALGINPDEIKAAITDTINGIRGGLQQLDNRLKNIEETQIQMIATLRRIETRLLIVDEHAEYKNGAIAVIHTDQSDG